MPRKLRRVALLTLSAACMLAATPATAGTAGRPRAAEPIRDVLLVGNNWDGTDDVIDVHTFTRLARINVVPDLAERMAEITADPVKLGFFLLIRQQIGEGHDQLVDDTFSSPDGRTIYVSRPSMADVVAIDLATRKIVWRAPVDGYRSDHMAISHDGTRLLVSASTTKVVDVIDTASGKIVGRIASGDGPHENNFSRDGNLVFHGSIGRVYIPTNDPASDAAKGERVFEIIDAHTLQVLRKIDMRRKLADFGMPGMSPAVRPMALSPDERFVYFQVSYFHGFVEYDLRQDRVTRVARLPLSDRSRNLRDDQYILNSAHHGIQMNPQGTKLCVAATMSDYAAIVQRATFAYRVIPVGVRPYWATNSGDGRYCFISVAGENRISVISYESEQEVASIPVGYHPQRTRMAKVATAIFGAPSADARQRPGVLSLRAQSAGGRRVRFSGTLALPPGVAPADGCRGSVVIELRRGRAVLARTEAPLRAGRGSCAFKGTIRAPGRGAGARRLSARARFDGNGVLLPQRSTSARLRLR
jgi:DNA-binding beta-propeller fold protein YncE